MSDIPNGISIRELRVMLDEAEKRLNGHPENIPVLIEAVGRKTPFKLTGKFEIDYGMVLVKAK